MTYRSTRRRHPVRTAMGLTVLIFVGMAAIAAILTYGPAMDAWAAKQRDPYLYPEHPAWRR